VLRPLNRVEELRKTLLETPGVEDARLDDDVVEADLTDSSDEACCALLEIIIRAGYRILEFRPRRADLEQIFLDVTRGEVQ
jgi:ABC-2 type transport system ATP-binding protein